METISLTNMASQSSVPVAGTFLEQSRGGPFPSLVNQAVLEFLYPHSQRRFVPAPSERVSMRDRNDSDSVMGMLVYGRANITSFLLSLQEKRLSRGKDIHFLGPVGLPKDAFFYHQDLFKPTTNADFSVLVKKPVIVTTAVSLVVWLLLILIRRALRSLGMRWSRRVLDVVIGTCLVLVTGIVPSHISLTFNAEPVRKQLRSWEDLLVELERGRVELLLESASARAFILPKSPALAARFEAVRDRIRIMSLVQAPVLMNDPRKKLVMITHTMTEAVFAIHMCRYRMVPIPEATFFFMGAYTTLPRALKPRTADAELALTEQILAKYIRFRRSPFCPVEVLATKSVSVVGTEALFALTAAAGLLCLLCAIAEYCICRISDDIQPNTREQSYVARVTTKGSEERAPSGSEAFEEAEAPMKTTDR